MAKLQCAASQPRLPLGGIFCELTLDELFDQLETLKATEKRVAMATLIATLGTGPRKEGSKMLVGEAGRILGSVTIGGCIDARVIEESEKSLASSESRIFSLSLGEEDAWETGFTCAGTVKVMVEPLDLTDTESRLLNLYGEVRAAAADGQTAVLATLLEDTSSKLVVFEGKRSIGSLGSEAMDREARTIALDLIQTGTSCTVALTGSSPPVDVFFEVHSARPTMVIFGAGPVSMPLVGLAREIGLKTIVVDGRPRFATRERFPYADELLVGIPSEIARTLVYTPSTLVVVTAHDYKYDIPILKVVLKTEAAYIGLLGSRKRGQSILHFLEESGEEKASLDRVRVPTGLDIGAQTAAEIALSILAEAMAVKAGRPGTPLQTR